MTNKIQFKDIIEEKKEEMKLQEEKEKEIARKEVEEELKEEGFTNIELKEQPFEEIKNSEGKPIEMISLFNKEYNDFSKEQIEKGSLKLEELIQKRDKVEKKLNSIIKRNDSLFDKFFQLVKATKQEQRNCVYYLTKKEEQEEDYLKKYLDEETLEKAQTRDELIENITKKAIKDEINDKENLLYYKYKNFNPEKANSNDFTKILDEQLFLTNDTLEGTKEAQSILVEFYTLSEKYSIFDFETDENHNITNIIRDEKANQEAIDLYFKIGEETTKAIEINRSFSILAQKKGIQNIFPFDLLEKEKNEIQELKMTLQEKENLQKIKFDRNKNLQLDSQVRFNDKISNHLTLLEKGEKATFNNIFGKTGKFKNEQVDVSTSETIDDFEREVLFLCYSVLKKNNSFTIRQIREKMTGRENRNETDLDKEIAKAIEKLRKTDFKIALSDELIKEKYFEIKEEFPSGLGGYILPLDFEEKTTSVNKYGINIDTYYFIKGQSPFFFYAERTGMIQTFGDKLIKCEGKKNVKFTSKERIVARQVLLSKIKTLQSLLFRKEELQKQKKWSQKQEQQFKNLQNIYLKDFKLPENYDKAKQRNIEFIENMLSNYQELKEIKSFQYITKENKFIIIPSIVNYKDIKMIGYEEQEED